MIRAKRLVPHDPENKLYGDCTRTCIASLLDLQSEEVPHFMDLNNPRHGWDLVYEFLRTKGYFLFTCPLNEEVDSVLSIMQQYNPELYWIMGCASINADHSVICRGGTVIFDPRINSTDELSLKRDSQNVVWINIIVPLMMRG